MKEHKIIIEIDNQGRIAADATGFLGDECLVDLERLLEDLAPGVAQRDRKTDSGGVRRKVSNTQSLRPKR